MSEDRAAAGPADRSSRAARIECAPAQSEIDEQPVELSIAGNRGVLLVARSAAQAGRMVKSTNTGTFAGETLRTPPGPRAPRFLSHRVMHGQAATSVSSAAGLRSDRRRQERLDAASCGRYESRM